MLRASTSAASMALRLWLLLWGLWLFLGVGLLLLRRCFLLKHHLIDIVSMNGHKEVLGVCFF